MIYLELLESLTKGIRFLVHLTIWTIVLTYVATVTLFCIGMPSDDWFVFRCSRQNWRVMLTIMWNPQGARINPRIFQLSRNIHMVLQMLSLTFKVHPIYRSCFGKFMLTQ